MGKLMHNTQIRHSAHPHLLHLSSNHLQNPINCDVCNLHISDHHFYTCTPCNFYLHPSCSKFPDLITHPSHPNPNHTLLPTPQGVFRCVACTDHRQGINNRFSYRCRICEFDLHVLCASKPLSVTNPIIHPHPLLLTFSSPYGENTGFDCDVCCGVGSGDEWLYRCVSCGFDVHLHCATAKVPPPLHHQHSFPNQLTAAQPLIRSVSAGHVQQPYWQPPPVAFQSYPPPPVAVQSYWPPPQPPAPVGAQSYGPLLPQTPLAPVGTVQGYSQLALPTLNYGVAGGLANGMVTRLVGGMVQQLGQIFVKIL